MSQQQLYSDRKSTLELFPDNYADKKTAVVKEKSKRSYGFWLLALIFVQLLIMNVTLATVAFKSATYDKYISTLQERMLEFVLVTFA
ncbi:hypothetical protein [Psychromonas aquimarina]|uniref:hypothetical protein n=1 Tax=Psychromonas aquimarina TaxID=444919 RepID=UPI0003F7B4D5|nr:hypothetical protein [Psychromonas aquimarina]